MHLAVAKKLLNSFVHTSQYFIQELCERKFLKFGQVAPSVKPSVLRHFYHELTGDSSAANCLNESETDARVTELLSMEPDDPKTIVD